MLIPNSENNLVICLRAWRRHPLRTLCPRNTAMDDTIRSSRVAACRRLTVEKPGGSATFAEHEKRNDLAKAIAAAATGAAPLSRSYHGTSSR
jgi:hypothetical protein